MPTMTPEQRQLRALDQVKAAVALFQAHLRTPQAARTRLGQVFNPEANPSEKDDEFWSYFAEVDRFRQVGDATHKAATAIGRAFGGPVRGRALATAFMLEHGVPLYWATWALAN